MPAQPEWLLHVPEIRALLEELGFPVIDRAMVESLFGLHRRRAIEMMHRFGGFQTGKTFLIDRLKLVEELKAIEAGEAFRVEGLRRRRLRQHLDEFRDLQKARRIPIPAGREAEETRVSSLVHGVVLRRGSLHIEFTGTEDLLAKLYQLGRAASHDYESFRAASEGADPSDRRQVLC